MKFPSFLSKWHYRCLLYILILPLLAMFISCATIEKQLFPTPPPTPPAGNCQLFSNGETLDALWMEGKEGMPVFLFSYGNYQRITDIKLFCKNFQMHGYGIFAYDYAGYGASTGKASSKQSCHDIEAAYDFLVKEKNVQPEDIVVIGYSVGSGPSCHLVSKHPAKALVLCAPFASAVHVVLPFSLPGDKFLNYRLLAKSKTPVLIFHGEKDSIIPVRNSKLLYKKAQGRKKLVLLPEADHNDLFNCLGDDFWKEMSDFLNDRQE
ncbi:MAG: alpha/beta fold hydrolase [Victivallales bacterium]|nr:alpha/beta fold hydrolase [Victivallales bacterium]